MPQKFYRIGPWRKACYPKNYPWVLVIFMMIFFAYHHFLGLAIWLMINETIHLSIFFCLSISFIFLLISLSICLSSLCSVCLFLFIPYDLSVYSFIFLLICLSSPFASFWSGCLFVCLVHVSFIISLVICLSICLSSLCSVCWFLFIPCDLSVYLFVLL